jgi:hypothetical protein
LNKAEIASNLTVSVVTALTKYAASKLSDFDPGDILSDKELQSLAESVLDKLSIGNRIKLYAEVFCSEIEGMAEVTGEKAVSDKIKKAARR